MAGNLTKRKDNGDGTFSVLWDDLFISGKIETDCLFYFDKDNADDDVRLRFEEAMDGNHL